jgi:hypothetical protein
MMLGKIFGEVMEFFPIAIDPTEQEFDELQEPAPVEEANPEQEKGKPRCI